MAGPRQRTNERNLKPEVVPTHGVMDASSAGSHGRLLAEFRLEHLGTGVQRNRDGPSSTIPTIMERMSTGAVQHLSVSTPDRGRAILNTKNTDVFLPPEYFVVDAIAARRIAPFATNGTLTFTVTTRYAHPAAIGVWIYRVTVDGIVRARWDGASHKRPVSVRIGNLGPQSVVALEVVALKTRLGFTSWSQASRARIENLHFEESVRTGEIVTVDLDPKDDRFEPFDGDVALRIEASEIARWSSTELTQDGEKRVSIITDHGVLPLLVVRQPGASRVVILSNGAVDLQRSCGVPIFQRSSWTHRIHGHQVYVCDPGTVGPAALSLSWGQIDDDYWVVPDLARAVQHISRALGVGESSRRLYYGSSAGGFLALGMAAFDDGCRAVINNAQFDWTRWMAGSVNALRAARFRNALPAALRERHPERTNVLNLLRAGRGPRSVNYLVNLASTHDREVDAPEMRRFLSENPEFREIVRIITYSDPVAGHNPLSQADTLAWIHAPAQTNASIVSPRFMEEIPTDNDVSQ